jgi:FixJ family two-component response regulator
MEITIAVVDDDESVRAALTGLIRSLGYRPIAFAAAEDFLNYDGKQAPACLIADVQMPGMTGLDLYSRLTESGRVIPTILITAYPNDRERAHALRTGVRCYLSKPFDEDSLLACLQSALSSMGQQVD